ncbi:MAG: PilZ domain-containing protein [Woeseiaceae bacterium]
MDLIKGKKYTNTNKRDDLRSLVNAQVKLSHSVFGEIIADTGNVSNNGVFVCINDKPTLPKGAHIKLQFMSSLYPDVSFNTRVVRSTDEGFGLVFVDFEYCGDRFEMKTLKHIWNKK